MQFARIPHDVGSLRGLHLFHVRDNSLRGPIPHAVGSLARLVELNVIGNSLRGPIPHDVGSLRGLESFELGTNSLSGAIPHAVGSMTELFYFRLGGNRLSGRHSTCCRIHDTAAGLKIGCQQVKWCHSTWHCCRIHETAADLRIGCQQVKWCHSATCAQVLVLWLGHSKSPVPSCCEQSSIMREGPRLRGPEKHLQQPPWFSPARWAARRLPPTSMQRQRLSRRLWKERLQSAYSYHVNTEPTSAMPPVCCVSLDIVSLVLAACAIWTKLWAWLRGRDSLRRLDGSGKSYSGLGYITKVGDDDQPRMRTPAGVHHICDMAEQYAARRFPRYRVSSHVPEQVVSDDPYPDIPHDLREQRIQRAQWHLECVELTRYQSMCMEKIVKKYTAQQLLVGWPSVPLGMQGGAPDGDQPVHVPPEQQQPPEPLRPRSRSRSRSPTPENEVEAAIREARAWDAYNVRMNTTRQTARVDRYNRHYRLAPDPEWQAQWRFRTRVSPPRFDQTAEQLRERWLANGRPAIQIRIMEQHQSRYVWFTLREMDPEEPFIRPIDLELMIRNSFFRGQQVRFILVDGQGFAFRHNEPMAVSRLGAVTAFPARPLGASSSEDASLAQQKDAFQLIKKNNPQLLTGKVLRTLLRAQPQLARRVLSSGEADRDRQRLLVVGAAQRAGLGALIPEAAMRGVTRKQGQQPVRLTPQHSSSQDKDSGWSLPVSPTPPEKLLLSPQLGVGSESKGKDSPGVRRWARRQDKDQGWQLVQKRQAPTQKISLVDEWNVPMASELCLGKTGVALAESREQLLAQAQAMKGNPCKTAMVFGQQVEAPLGVRWSVAKVAYHVNCEFMRNAKVTVQRQSRVGYLYQFHGSETVELRSKPKVATTGHQASTTVLRLQVHQKFCPPNKWSELQQGRLKVLSDQIHADIQTTGSELQKEALQDLFQMQASGRLISAMIRLKLEAVEPLLRLSGASWVFCQPIGDCAERYPVSWSPGPIPDSLTIPRKRASESGAVGLVIGDRRLGYRSTQESFEDMKNKLGQTSTTTWRLAGAPLTSSSTDATGWLTEMGLEGTLLLHTRRVRRGTQDWLVRAPEKFSPSSDTLALSIESREYLITLSKLLPRAGPPPGTRQWTSPSRGRFAQGSSPSESPAHTPPSGNSSDKSRPPPSKPATQQPKAVSPESSQHSPSELDSRLDKMSQILEKMQMAMAKAGLFDTDVEMESDPTGQKRAADEQLTKETADS